MHTITRTHEIACGHRVFGHESKCAHLHGHNYTFELTCSGCLDGLGRVIDFGVIKERLCAWLEATWDHRMLLWEKGPFGPGSGAPGPQDRPRPLQPHRREHGAVFGGDRRPEALRGTGVVLLGVTESETARCCATFEVS